MAKTDQETFDAMVAAIRAFCPRFKVGPKKARWHHRFVGKFLKAFRINNRYMEDYWTSFGQTAEWDEDDQPGEHYSQDWSVLPHEGKHGLQVMRNSMVLFGPLYILGTPLYLLFGLLLSLPFFITGALVEQLPWWSGWFPLGLGCLLSIPWPFGHWRGRWEMQAYRFSVAINYWKDGYVSRETLDHYIRQFKGPEYYWMGLAIKSPKQQLEEARQLAIDGKYIGSDKYFEKFERAIYNVMKDCGRVHEKATSA